MKLNITDLEAMEILDSRGNPTVEVAATVYNNHDGLYYQDRASVPSGASTGKFEAVEKRDGEMRYNGKGVLQAVNNVNTTILEALKGEDALDQRHIDTLMIALDGSANKQNLGANAMLGVSLALAKAAAKGLGLSLCRYVGGVSVYRMPVPMMNILNGGAHVAGKDSQDFQEFMIVPVGADSFREALRMGTEVYHSLKSLLNAKGQVTAVGDEGGFAPRIESVEAVLNLLMQAVCDAGFQSGKDICFALDVAASEWKPTKESAMIMDERKITGQFLYHLPKSGKVYTTEELISFYKELVKQYPIISIEDPLDEEDWEGWKEITKELGDKVQLVGDDLFVTNTKRLKKGIEKGCANSILIKLNQIGTLSETIDAIHMAHKAGYTAIVSHRSGETEDTTIADLAVALGCGQIKTGAPCRSERVAKFNQLLRLERDLGKMAFYPGMQAFTDRKEYL